MLRPRALPLENFGQLFSCPVTLWVGLTQYRPLASWVWLARIPGLSSYCLWVLTSHLSDLTALQEGPEGHQLATCSAVCMRDTAFTHTDRSCIVPRGHIPLLNCKPQAAKALSSESQGGATSPMEQLGWTGSHFSGLLWGMVIWVPHRQDSWSVLLSAPSPPTASLLPAVAFLHLTFDGLVPR